MLGPYDYLVWMIGFLAEVTVVVCSVRRHEFKRYLSLQIYMCAAAFTQVGHLWMIHHFGFTSIEYRYFYYYSENLLTVLMFFAIMQLYEQVFCEMKASRYVRGGAVLLLALAAAFSYLVVHQHRDNLTSRFVVELGQNMYFVGVVLTYLLWGAVVKLHETRLRLIQLVLALGVYFSATAATYALRNLFPGLEHGVLKFLFPLAGAALPAAWAYTFIRVPETARLAAARIAMAHR